MIDHPDVVVDAASGGRRGSPLRRWVIRCVMGVLLVFVVHQAITWPDVAALRDTPPETTAFIERAREAVGPVHWRWVPQGEIAVSMKVAVIVAEDNRFFQHGGFDHVETRLAIRDAIRERDLPRGASTITQQLARNLWLSPSRDPFRKVKEAMLAAQLERTLSKGRILEIYLNVVQFAPDVFGVEAASQRFFGVPASELDDPQAATLAALLPAPTLWSPDSRAPRYVEYRQRILGRMTAASALRARFAA